jgi:hypothetical protein
MSDLVPNLPELISALPPGSDGIAVAGAFEAENVEAARATLRAVLVLWEETAVSRDAAAADSAGADVE